MTISWADRLDGLSRIGFDTNALIYFLGSRGPYYNHVAQAIELMDGRHAIGVISSVVEFELLVKPLRENDSNSIARIGAFLNQQANLVVRPVDRTVARRAADVRARTRIDPIDAIVVATCLEEGCDAIIGNDSDLAGHFADIPYIYIDDYIS